MSYKYNIYIRHKEVMSALSEICTANQHSNLIYVLQELWIRIRYGWSRSGYSVGQIWCRHLDPDPDQKSVYNLFTDTKINILYHF